MKILRPVFLFLLLPMLGISLGCRRLADLRDKGGIALLIAVSPNKVVSTDEAVKQTIAVISGRCDRLGIFCGLEQQSGDKANQIMLHVSSSMDPVRVKRILFAEGLEIRAVISEPSPHPVVTYKTQSEAVAAAGYEGDIFPYYDESMAPAKYLVAERTPIVTGQDIRQAQATSSQEQSRYSVAFTLKPEGAARLADWTGKNINRYLAIILNKQVRTVAFIRSQISDSGEISGRFTKEDAEDIAIELSSGNLPASIELIQEGTYTR